jgi:DNA-binding response OmpR family regulator
LNIQGDRQLLWLTSWILDSVGYDVIDTDAIPQEVDRPLPDIILINTSMLQLEKRACIVALRSLVPGVGILDLAVDAEELSYDTGADQYLGKPFRTQDLLDRVHALVA